MENELVVNALEEREHTARMVMDRMKNVVPPGAHLRTLGYSMKDHNQAELPEQYHVHAGRCQPGDEHELHADLGHKTTPDR